jgi:hypothetical protein
LLRNIRNDVPDYAASHCGKLTLTVAAKSNTGFEWPYTSRPIFSVKNR